jgi:hypothetical protein
MSNRKRANKVSPREKATSKISRDDAMPLQQNEAYIFKELIDQSNLYGKLMRQYEEIDFTYQNLVYKRKQIQKDEIKISKESPIYVPLLGNSLVPLTDKKKVLKDIDDQLKGLKLQRDGVKGQMVHRRDEFVEAALRLKTFIDNRFGKYTSVSIGAINNGTGVRVKAGKEEEKKKEQKLFEAEFEKIMNDAETQEEFKKALNKAKKENKELVK